MRSETGEIYLIKALFDKGSEVNIMSEKLVRMLKLKKERLIIEVSGIIGKNVIESGVVKTMLNPWYNEQTNNGIMTKFIVLKELPRLGRNSLPERINEFEELQLADPHYEKSCTFNILLGLEFWAKIIQNQVIRSPTGLCAQGTAFGYVIFGGITTGEHSFVSGMSLKISINTGRDLIMNQLMARFWELSDSKDTKYTVSEE